jgi:hypothetical protein
MTGCPIAHGHDPLSALVQELAVRGVRGVAVGDPDRALATKVAERIGGVAVECDVGDPAAVQALVDTSGGGYDAWIAITAGRVASMRSGAADRA